MFNKVETLSYYPATLESLSRETSACLNELYCVSVQKVAAGDQTWSVSCPSCPCSLCSPLVSTSSPPTTATNMWTYLTRSALPCVVLSTSTCMFVVGIYCTCVWRAVYMCVFAYMYICVCIAIVHIRTVLIFAICYIQSFMATLMVAPSPLLGSVSMKACTLHLSLLRPPLPADYRIRFNFHRVKLSRFSRISSHPRKFQRLRPCIRKNKNAKIAKICNPRKFNAANV